MGHRLSKIATRTGDQGETGLGDGSRVSKSSARIAALGEVDELNCALGLVLAGDVPDAWREAFGQIQQDLFDVGGELSIPGHTMVKMEDVARLDALLEDWNSGLAPLKEFILPGGTAEAAAAHLARAVCRRAERAVVTLNAQETVGAALLQYLNRLSDLLFVAGRGLNKAAGRGDVQWRHERKR